MYVSRDGSFNRCPGRFCDAVLQTAKSTQTRIEALRKQFGDSSLDLQLRLAQRLCDTDLLNQTIGPSAPRDIAAAQDRCFGASSSATRDVRFTTA
jgi:hypothetical protein